MQKGISQIGSRSIFLSHLNDTPFYKKTKPLSDTSSQYSSMQNSENNSDSGENGKIFGLSINIILIFVMIGNVKRKHKQYVSITLGKIKIEDKIKAQAPETSNEAQTNNTPLSSTISIPDMISKCNPDTEDL